MDFLSRFVSSRLALRPLIQVNAAAAVPYLQSLVHGALERRRTTGHATFSAIDQGACKPMRLPQVFVLQRLPNVGPTDGKVGGQAMVSTILLNSANIGWTDSTS